MDANWKARVIEKSQRRNETEEQEFLELVDLVNRNCTLDVARTLMKTFSSKPDYGTQERVISVLASGERKVMIQAILEELPRLQKEAPDWVEALLGPELEHRFELLQETLVTASKDVKKVVKEVIEDPDFCDFFPSAKRLNF